MPASYELLYSGIKGWGIVSCPLILNSIFFYEGKSYAWYLNEQDAVETQRLEPSYDIDISAGFKRKWFGLTYNLQGGVYNLLDSNGYDYYYLRKRMFMISFSVNY